jgi:hypothetical protein
MAGIEKWAYISDDCLLVWVGDNKGCDRPETKRLRWPMRNARHELDSKTLKCRKCGAKPRLSDFARKYLRESGVRV